MLNPITFTTAVIKQMKKECRESKHEITLKKIKFMMMVVDKMVLSTDKDNYLRKIINEMNKVRWYVSSDTLQGWGDWIAINAYYTAYHYEDRVYQWAKQKREREAKEER